MKSRTVLAVIAAAVGLGSATAGAQEAIDVTIGWQPAALQRFYAANEFDLWKEAGFEEENVRFNAGPPMFAALKSGDVDVAFMGSGAAINAISQGIDLRIIAVEQEDAGILGLVARNDADIKSVADLKGKRIATLLGSTAHYGLLRSLEKAGLSADSVEILPLDYPAQVPALRNGDVDGLWTWPPNLYLGEDVGHIVTTHAEQGIPSPGVWVATAEWLSNPEAGVRLIKVLDLASQKLKEDPERVIGNIATTLGVNKDLAMRNYNAVVNPTVEQMADPQFSLSLIGPGFVENSKDIAGFLHERGVIKEIPDLEATIDTAPLKAYLATK